jgi:hypothetical protein
MPKPLHIALAKDRLQMVEDAIEANIFYHNQLTHPTYVKKYFPIKLGENELQYKSRPKISVPITQGIIDRIINILLKTMKITSESIEIQEIINELYTKANFREQIRSILVNTIVTGNNLTVIIPGWKIPQIILWQGEYVLNLGNQFGYCYTIDKERGAIPVTNSTIEKDIIVVFIDEFMYGDLLHNFGINPSILTKNIDLYINNLYGKPFSLRFKDMVVDYNKVRSSENYQIIDLPTIWLTTANINDPYNPIQLQPGTITSVGKDGDLKQAARQVNIDPEEKYLETLERKISAVSQVPGELSGLKAVGQIPSGVALQILFEPLVEIVERFSSALLPKIVEITDLAIKMYYLSNEKMYPIDTELRIDLNKDIYPEAKNDTIDRVLLLLEKGIIDLEQAKRMIDPVVDIDGIE